MDTALPRNKTHVLINRNFALFWFGQIISLTGDFFLDTTLVLWITTVLAKGQSWVALAIGGVGLAATLPTLLVGPLAGVFVDRWDKRQMMMRMDIARALLILALIVLTGLVPLPLAWHLPLAGQLAAIYVILILASSCSQFFNPGYTALLGDIVAPEERTRAMSISQAAINIALLFGPALAAPLFFAFGARWAMLIDAVSFVGSCFCLFCIQAPPAARSVAANERGNYLREMAAGWQLILKERALAALIITGIIFLFGAGTSSTLYVLFAINNLHTPNNLLGFFGPAYGAGVIAISFLAVRIARRVGEGRMLGYSLLIWGFLMVLFSRMTSFIPGLLIFFLLGVANGGINVCSGPLFLYLVPREFIGRVSAIRTPCTTAAGMLSLSISGYLVSGPMSNLSTQAFGLHFGALDTVFFVEGFIVVLSGVYTSMALASVSTKLA